MGTATKVELFSVGLEGSTTTIVLDLSLALHNDYGPMLAAIEEGCGKVTDVIRVLSSRVELALLEYPKEEEDELFVVVVVNAPDDGAIRSTALHNIVSGAMTEVFMSNSQFFGEPVFWLWCGAHGRAKWMTWNLNPQQARAVNTTDDYSYPWSR